MARKTLDEVIDAWDHGREILADLSANGFIVARHHEEDAAVALDLLMIEPDEHPVYIVVKSYMAADDPDADKEYFYEEHTCPTNVLPCEAIIENGDEDPHGVLTFVRSIPIPADYDGTADWRTLFPEVAAVTPSTGKSEPPPGWVGEDGK